MDRKFSSCVLNWPLWPWYLGKSQGLAKAKADYLFLVVLVGPKEGPERKSEEEKRG